ncbi:MAG: S8 family serine peptidase [Gaiellaceae bacterium]
MDRIRRIPLLVVAFIGLLALGGPASQAAPPQTSVPGEILIGFRSDTSPAEQKSVLKAAGATEKKSFAKIHGALAHVAPDEFDATLAKLRKDKRVRYAEPNFVVRAEITPNDPAYGNLWGLSSIGAPAAWNVTTGSAGVTVADIDTGVDWSHPDLSSDIWLNRGEDCSGCRNDGVDNDANGYVDDWHGWDFVNGDNNPTDDHGHGTHVAGTIGAAGNNGLGVAGVNWNVRIMPVKFLNAQGSGTTANAVAAVLYAAQNGADVMNNSWAGGDYSQALADAIAVADQRNSLFVAAAGNDGANNDSTPTYPASYDLPNVLSVAATDNFDNRAYFSNYGKQSVDLGAPGVNIYSTWPGASYQSLSGTSMATPHVAGAAALAKAAFPSATDVGLKSLLIGTVDARPSLASTTASGGRLNVGSAVACSGTPQVWLDSPGAGFSVDVGTPMALSFIASNCGAAAGVSVTATANGSAVMLSPRGDGVYTGSFTPTARGAVTISVSATVGARTATRTVAGSATQAYAISPGGPAVTITTTSAGEAAQLRFNGTAGENVSLAMSSVTFSAAAISLLRPGGGTIASTYAGTSGGFLDPKTLPVTGVYTIAVSGFGSATGSMTLRLYDVPADAGGTITPGGGASSLSISTPGQNGRLTFSGTAGQRISLQFTNVTLSLALVSLLKPDGTTLVGNSYVGTYGAFVDTKTLPTTGTYAIVVDPQGAAMGSLTATLYDVPPDAGDTITPGGPSVTMTTTVPGQNGRLTFTGTAGQRIDATISSVTLSSATASILGPDGNPVGGSTFFGPGLTALMDVRTLPTTGTYAIVVDPPGQTTGSATFRLFDVPPDVSDSLTPGGPSATATMSTPGQNAKLTFTGAAGQRVSLNVSPSTLSQAYVSIAKPDGSSFVGNTLFATTGAFVDTRVLPVAGTYTITVDPQGTATGSATLTLYDVPADAGGTTAVGDPPLPVAVATPGQNARISFSARAGQAISVKLTSVTISIGYLSILKPDGSALVSNQIFSSFDRTITATIPADGNYTIVLDPQGAATGSLNLTVA